MIELATALGMPDGLGLKLAAGRGGARDALDVGRAGRGTRWRGTRWRGTRWRGTR
jgi:hypothetical protein